MALVFLICNFFINKDSQGGKSVCGKSTYYCKFGFTGIKFLQKETNIHSTHLNLPETGPHIISVFYRSFPNRYCHRSKHRTTCPTTCSDTNWSPYWRNQTSYESTSGRGLGGGFQWWSGWRRGCASDYCTGSCNGSISTASRFLFRFYERRSSGYIKTYRFCFFVSWSPHYFTKNLIKIFFTNFLRD